jgi:hypothetical protein
VKTPERNNLKEERFIWAHSFRNFNPWSIDSIAFRPMARQKHCRRRTWQKKAIHLMAARKQRGITERDQSQNVSFTGISPSYPLTPTRPHLPQSHHLPIVFSNSESIHGLNHSLESL